MQIRSIVVDDEAKSRQNLIGLLQRYCEEVEVLASVGNAVEGMEAIRNHQPDLVFMDIEMPLGSGFDLLDHARPWDFEVVFVTGYTEYAEQAFDYNALHYLRKPIHPLRLQEAIRRYKALKSDPAREAPSTPGISPPRKDPQIALPTQSGSDVLNLEEIVRCRASGSYSEIFLENGSRLVYALHLGELEERLDPQFFFRIHNSWIVQRKYIRKYVRGKGGQVILHDQSEVDVSARRKKDFLNWLHG